MSTALLPVAQAMTAAGLSVIPILSSVSKAPDGRLLPPGLDGTPSWSPFQTRQASAAELVAWFGPAEGIAVLGGVVSGGLTIIDFDVKEGGADLYDAFAAEVDAEMPGLLERIPLVGTPSGGRHLYLRCSICERPEKLALSPKRATWIETKAEGGYCLAPKSSGYQTMRGSLLTIPTISPEEREYLLAVARSYSMWVPAVKDRLEGEKPGAAFNARMTLDDMQRWLCEAGWSVVSTRHDGTRLLRRPGKADGISATLGQGGGRSLYVFTSNGQPFDANQGYSAFAVHAHLRHGGDFAATARELIGNGYGGQARVQRGGQSEQEPLALSVVVEAPIRVWPTLPAAALYGLAGDVVAAIAPHTEADDAAVLLTTLLFFGNAISHAPHALAGGSRHTANTFGALVGDTAKGRKGSSLGPVKSLFRRVDEVWSNEHIVTGLSSGEGIVYVCRDAGEGAAKDGTPADSGVTDKRLMVVEEELAGPLKLMAREGNTLSAILRQAWDSGTLRILTKNSPIRATGAHISILGHITRQELERYLAETEAANGFANRFVWCCCRRSKLLPDGGDEPAWGALVPRLFDTISFARSTTAPMKRDPEARARWHEIYGKLSEGRPGLLGALLSRAEAHVLRFSVLYALLDCSPSVCLPHLEAAIALWSYFEASARYIFGDKLGDPVADMILEAVRAAGADGMDRTAINILLGKNQPAARIQAALSQLREAQLVESRREMTAGAPRTIFVACQVG